MTDQPNKPTPEELKAKEDEAIQAAEELEGAQQIPSDEEEPTPPQDPEPVVEDQAEPSEEEKEALRQRLEAEKKKSSASARENQKIYAKNRVMNQALVEADAIPDPTEEELQKEFRDWDVMSETERTFAKETVISRNWRQVISQAKNQATKIDKWTDSVMDFADDPATLVANPELEGKTEAFKTFATEEGNNSVPFTILVSAFLHEVSKGKALHKGKMFENGSGGPNEKPQPKSDKLNLEQARRLRETDYGKYKEMLLAGKIETDL